jgi:hypothetical protein
MKAQKHVRSVAKTPGEWAIVYHNALVELAPGREVTLVVADSQASGRAFLRSFHGLVKLLPRFPLHTSAQHLASLGPATFRGRLIPLNEGACGVVISCKHDPAGAVADAVNNLTETD